MASYSLLRSRQSILAHRLLAAILAFDYYPLAAAALGVLLFQPLFARGLPQAPDALLHFYRSFIWRDAWNQGIVYPRWDTVLYQGYGYPLFDFQGPLLYIGSSLLRWVTPSMEVAYKGMIFLACLAYPLGMYQWSKRILGRNGAFVAAAAYTFATIRFRELYFVGGYGQFAAWSLFPWILLCFHGLATRSTKAYFLGAVFSLAALVLMHNISAMWFLPVLMAYALGLALSSHSRQTWATLLAAGALGVAVAAVFFIPALAESGYTRLSVLTQGIWDVSRNFVRPAELVAAIQPLDDRAVIPWLPFTFGRLHVALAAVGALGLLRRSSRPAERATLAFACVGLAVSAFLMVPSSLPVWRAVPLLSFTEYPWRLFGLAFLFSSLLAGSAVNWLERLQWLHKAAAAVLAAALVLVVGVYQFPRPFLTMPESVPAFLTYETSFRSMGTTGGGELLSRSTTQPPPAPALDSSGARVALVNPGPGQAGRVAGAGPQYLRVQATLESPGDLTFAQFYFPGWTATVDGVPAAIRPAPGSGCIQITLPAGAHDILLEFRDTPVRTAAGIISLLALLATGAVAAFGLRSLPITESPNAPTTGALVQKQGEPSAWCPPPGAESESPRREVRDDRSGLRKSRTPTIRSGSALGLLCLFVCVVAVKALWLDPYTQVFRFTSPAGTAQLAGRQLPTSASDGVALLGYDLDTTGAVQGGELRVRLYWQALQPLGVDYSSYVQLIGGPDRTRYASSDHQHPGSIPTKTWTTSRYVVDDHFVTIAPETPAVPLRLEAGLFDAGGGTRLASFELPEWVYVRSAHPVEERDVPPGVQASFGTAIRLLGEQVTVAGGEALVTLYWQASGRVDGDYQVFVHLAGADGVNVAQADAAPLGGLYPTSLWVPGQIICDVHRLPLPASSSQVSEVRLGLYSLATMQRLPARHTNGVPWPDDAVRVSVPAGR